MPAADDDFAAWFRLLETPGLGRTGVRRLLAACGSPQAVLDARPAVWRDAAGGQAAAALAHAEAPEFAGRLGAATAWLAGASDRHALTIDRPEYPPLLLQTADPPLLLYVQGTPGVLSRPALAIVGSRNPTAQGSDNARAFAASLSAQDFVVVSGLALGIDGAAHDGALDGAAGTVAVVGTGLDRVYPQRHHALAHRIAAQGALVSEYAPGVPVLPEHFPQRNRIIAGLSLGTLVVEAALRSGSLITARLALEAGRDVFAVPGSIHSPQSKGCHALIKQGAKLVESAADILDELRGTRARVNAVAAVGEPADTDPEAPADPLLDAMGHDPVTLDALVSRTGWPASDLAVRLLDLELRNVVARLPGGLYQRRGIA